MNDRENDTLINSTAGTDTEPVSEKARTVKPHLTAKWVIIHVGHALLVAVHVVALIAALKGWAVNINLADASRIQTGVTAASQVSFIGIIGLLLSLAREIATDAAIRHPPTLGLLHLRLKAWSSLSSSLSANWLYSRSHDALLPASPGLRRVIFYLGLCQLLQVSSGSIFASSFTANISILPQATPPFVQQGARFGDFDSLWSPGYNITSADTRLFPPATQIAAVTMFSGRTNDTRYPGLHGRLLHDTVNLDDRDNAIDGTIPWTIARVNATLVNVHCSQISNAKITTFLLPVGSTDMHLAQTSPSGFVFRNASSYTNAAWLNVSIPAPPYWDPVVPGLNISALWGSSKPFNDILPTGVFFQPWAFPATTWPIGHNQLVLVIATQRAEAILVDSTGSIGAALNLTTFPDYDSAFPNSEASDGRQAYVQVLGCTATNTNLNATINPVSRLLIPLTSAGTLMGPELPHDNHPWDEFAWGTNETALESAERQFLLAFTPSTPYNNTWTNRDYPLMPIGSPESILANLLEDQLSSPFDDQMNLTRNALVSFQGSLEHLFASYLHTVNRLCSPVDFIQPYSETCGTAGRIYGPGFGWAEFDLESPGHALIVVLWRAVVSFVASVLMWITVSTLLGAGRSEGGQLQQADGFLDSARLMSRGSRIPELVAAEMKAVKYENAMSPEVGLLETLVRKRLRFFLFSCTTGLLTSLQICRTR
ncbi:hypothetical protein B0H11DRAFT_2035621 [Mycena galericulata]|nr:hypothetical protein B0H11DRAFT_2035621 [Mycena galericulata]